MKKQVSGDGDSAAPGGGDRAAELVADTAWSLVDTARGVVERVAPEELQVFDAVAAGWRDKARAGRGTWSAPGSSVGFGIDAMLVSELVLQAIASAVGEVLVLGAVTVRSRTVRSRWWRRRRKPATPAGETVESGGDDASTAVQPVAVQPVAVQPVDTRRLTVTAEQARQLREACQRHAITLGLPPETADLLADAVVGALYTAPEQR